MACASSSEGERSEGAENSGEMAEVEKAAFSMAAQEENSSAVIGPVVTSMDCFDGVVIFESVYL